MAKAKAKTKKAPSAKQLAARRRFAEMARSGALKKKAAAARRRKHNVEMGFTDSTGFHPIRASKDYDPDRTDSDTIEHVRRGSIPRRGRNVAAGFVDEDGVFHPIRASYDYSAARAGERSRGRGYARKGAKKQTRRRNQLGAAIIGGLGSALGGKLVDDLEDKKPAPPARQKNFSFGGLFGKKKKRAGGRTQRGRKVAPKKKRTLSRGDYNKLYRAHFGAARKKALAEISPARFGRNPKGEHVAGLAPRYQRLYEDILASHSAKTRYGKRLKEVASRTARKVAAAGVNPDKFREANPGFFSKRSRITKKEIGSRRRTSRRGLGFWHLGGGSHKGIGRKMRKLKTGKLRPPRRFRLFNDGKGVFEEFRGRSPERVSTAKGHGRDGSVIHVDELGKLREMTVGDKDISFGTSARLVAGPDKRLRIAGVRFKKTGKTHDCGEVDWIVYKADKPHHGKPKPLEWEHPFGEEGGRKPHLMIDPEGYPYLRGGDYKIESAGIID